MTNIKDYTIETDQIAPFFNHSAFCIGTGRMGLALRKEYWEQLKFVQKDIGFQHIRGHGLFCDDMAIYQEYKNPDGETVAEYNFTYLDMVMDSYRAVNIRPFLELGFMPEKLASGTQTVFYWKGNVTPPKDYEAWTNLVCATLRHLMERYGADEVVTWPIEVWNEPNLAGFWKDANREEYFCLFRCTFHAIKKLDVRFRVGGPAICGIEDELWIRSFLNFCRENHIAVDFVTRHFYTIDPPEHIGHYSYGTLRDPQECLDELKNTREIVDSFEEFHGIEIHVTEFNTSYTPDDPLHDTNRNAAYIAYLLSRMGDYSDSYSYWTFGDVFEENGVPFAPFHGGFGLVANGLIPKPTFWTFKFYEKLHGTCVHRSENSVVVRREDGSYRGVAWNFSMQNKKDCLSLNFHLPYEKNNPFCLLTQTVDETCCNPLKLWHDMGEPANLSREQLAVLRAGSAPGVTSQRIIPGSDKLPIALELAQNAVEYFEVNTISKSGDRGFSYERATQA